MTHSRSRILFASTHCVIDFSSGAAIATSDVLKLLARIGFDCRAFCAAKLDLETDERFEQILADVNLRARFNQLVIGGRTVRLLHVLNGLIPVEVLRVRSTRMFEWSRGEPEAMLAVFDRLTRDSRPDVLLTYGGDPPTQAMIRTARRRQIPVVFALHNFAYHDASMFRRLDHVIVPSEFSRRWYEQELGLKCHVLPYAIDWGRVCIRGQKSEVSGQERQRVSTIDHTRSNAADTHRFVTFVNPQPAKGVFVFAGIAEQLQRRRPDIPILVVESRGGASWLERTDVDLSWAPNLHAMANTHDPRDFYAVTKTLLVPSLWNESFGLVAAEAMINGIPVLASDRGALPEILGSRQLAVGSSGEGGADSPDTAACSVLPTACPSGGFLFHIPSQYTPETTLVPSAAEIEPWVETVIRLWDDDGLYRECSEKARVHAQQWHPDRLGPVYAEFFRNVRPQPG